MIISSQIIRLHFDCSPLLLLLLRCFSKSKSSHNCSNRRNGSNFLVQFSSTNDLTRFGSSRSAKHTHFNQKQKKTTETNQSAPSRGMSHVLIVEAKKAQSVKHKEI